MTISNLTKYKKGVSDTYKSVQYNLSATETPILTQQIGPLWSVASRILHKSDFSTFKFKHINTE